MASPVNVLFVSHTGDWGGAEALLVSLLRGLDRERFAPVVVLPGAGHLERELAASDVPIELVDQAWWVFPSAFEQKAAQHLAATLLPSVCALRDLIERRQVDVVVSNSIVIPAAALAARLCGRPHLWRVHELLGRSPSLRTLLPLPTFLPLVGALTDKVSAVSDAVRGELVPHLGEEKVERLYNGLDVLEESVPRDAALLPGRQQVVAVVGSIAAGKGVLDLVPAARQVLSEAPGAGFLIVGEDGGAEATLRAQIEAQGLTRAFRLTGFRQDAARLIAQSDLLVLPSLADSLPTVVLEAMAAGVPVVATRSGGAEELVVEGVTGLLVAPGEPAALARAIATLLSHEGERRAMGERGRERLRTHFSRAAWLAGFSRTLQGLAAASAAPTAGVRDTAWALALTLGELAGSRAAAVRAAD